MRPQWRRRKAAPVDQASTARGSAWACEITGRGDGIQGGVPSSGPGGSACRPLENIDRTMRSQVGHPGAIDRTVSDDRQLLDDSEVTTGRQIAEVEHCQEVHI